MKGPRYIELDGFLFPAVLDPKTVREAMKYVPEKGRIVVATYPKCGTTWTLQIVMLLLRRGEPPADAREYFTLLPYFEMTPVTLLQNLPKDASIKTHLPFDRITFSNEVKYIYVARHPADCVVSYYHHAKYFPIYFFSDGTFDDFFEIFITGKIDCGDYFDNLLSWYEHRHDPNVLFITFESLKADPKRSILKIAKFIGDDVYEDLIRDDETVLNKVMKYSSIDYMKKTVDKFWKDNFITKMPSKTLQALYPAMKNYARLFVEATQEGNRSIGNFVRKGAVGDGQNILSEDQKMRLEARIREKVGHSDVMNLWNVP